MTNKDKLPDDEKERHEKVKAIPRKDLMNAIILLVDELKQSDKASIFVKHIEEHIKKMGIGSHGGKVICKICDKDIDEIYGEKE